MDNREKVKMKINIAGEHLLLTVPFSDQEQTRDAEKNLNMLYETWRKRFPEKSEMELLAMIAFQYASYYEDLKRTYLGVAGKVEKMEAKLDKMIGENA